ncbi:hypothetical protein N1851_007030 [Merluccius polli]|uniref:Uncharacterized protein n=1 Tax=Merluccius polli TaxID=89951 RepID=A0AA47N4W1_MERPO|nr:hypothetical protein N1851_030003 [Merluccius polli]KAK0151652.1 hypothetical protein N1851_007030 [Merluccius polli]
MSKSIDSNVYVPVSEFPRAIITNFWNSANISDRTRQKGLQYAFEGYIHDISGRLENDALQMRPNPIDHKQRQRRLTLLALALALPPEAKQSRSSNVLAQQGYCSHVVGLVYALDLAITKARDAEPCTSSCTSLPQQWHKPRGNKIRAVPISTVVVAKATENRRRRPIDCRTSVTDEKLSLLKRQTGTPISYLVNRPPIELTVGEEKYLLGSGLSHQLPLIDPPGPLSADSHITFQISLCQHSLQIIVLCCLK